MNSEDVKNIFDGMLTYRQTLTEKERNALLFAWQKLQQGKWK